MINERKETLEINYENNKAKENLDKLYLNVDIVETLSNLTDKWIKKTAIVKLNLKIAQKSIQEI